MLFHNAQAHDEGGTNNNGQRTSRKESQTLKNKQGMAVVASFVPDRDSSVPAIGTETRLILWHLGPRQLPHTPLLMTQPGGDTYGGPACPQCNGWNLIR